MKNLISKTLFCSIIIFGLTSVTSCKKKKDEDNTPQNTGTNNGNVTVNAAGGYYAKLQAGVGHVMYFSGGVAYDPGYNGTFVSAQFTSQPFVSYGTVYGSDVDAGTVSLNGAELKKDTNPIRYSDTTYSIVFPPQLWHSAGSAYVDAFSYTNNDSVPVYTGYTQMPDTIHKSQGLTLPITGLSGCDEVQLMIYGSSGYILKNYSASGLSQISIPATEFSSVSTGSIYVSLEFSKDNFQTISGKSYKFQTTAMYFFSSVDLEP